MNTTTTTTTTTNNFIRVSQVYSKEFADSIAERFTGMGHTAWVVAKSVTPCILGDTMYVVYMSV